MKAKNYRVVWEIDIEAKDAFTAACEAREIQLNAENIATFFKVCDNSNYSVGEVAPGFESIDISEGRN